MTKNLKNSALFFCTFICLFLSSNLLSQENEINQDSSTIRSSTKKFHLGLFIGTYFANKYSANMYDGYGYTTDGIKNDFANSFINQQLNYYSGKYASLYSTNTGTITGNDLVAQTLGVAPGAWSFNQSDMPFDLTYSMTYLVGFNGKYSIDKKNAIIFNINGTKLTVNGKFTIATTSTVTGSTVLNNIKQGTITGGEQRTMFQLGYQKILGTNDKINFFVEGGLNIVIAKYLKNQVLIQNSQPSGAPLVIDLATIYSLPQYNYYHSKLIGVGLGLFAGFGINLTINPKYTIQVLYNPSYDKINIGDAPVYKLHNGFGLRFYYNL